MPSSHRLGAIQIETGNLQQQAATTPSYGAGHWRVCMFAWMRIQLSKLVSIISENTIHSPTTLQHSHSFTLHTFALCADGRSAINGGALGQWV